MIEVKARDLSELEKALWLSAKDVKIAILCNKDKSICPQVYSALEKLISRNKEVMEKRVGVFTVNDADRKNFADVPSILFYVNGEKLAKMDLDQENVSLVQDTVANTLNVLLSYIDQARKYAKNKNEGR